MMLQFRIPVHSWWDEMPTSIWLPDVKSIRNGLLDTTGRHYTHVSIA